MSSDATNIVASVVRSLEPDKSLSVSQRASEIAQAQLADESVSLLHRVRTPATDALTRNKIKNEHEQRRRQFERHQNSTLDNEENDDVDGPHIDVVV